MSPVPAYYKDGQTWICFLLSRVHLDPCYWSHVLQQAPRPLRLCFLVGTSPADWVQKGVLCLISISYGERWRARTVRCGTRAWRGTVTFRAQLHGSERVYCFPIPSHLHPARGTGEEPVRWASLLTGPHWRMKLLEKMGTLS